MDGSRVLHYLIKEHQEQLDRQVELLVDGDAKSYDEYKRIVGVIHGLRIAISTIHDTHDRLIKQEDMDG